MRDPIWNNMSETGKRHMQAILDDSITKTNVAGLRKIVNTQYRKDHGYSTSYTAPKIGAWEVAELEESLASREPRVVGALHDSGVKLLQGKRYRKRLAPVADIIADIDCFRLIGFQEAGSYRGSHTPVYRCVGRNGKSFAFINVPWQSGGNGPEII